MASGRSGPTTVEVTGDLVAVASAVKREKLEVQKWWKALLAQHPRLKGAIEHLEQSGTEGCAPDHLMWLLDRVNRSRTERWQKISKTDLADITSNVRRVVGGLETLRRSEIRRQVLPGSEDPELLSLQQGLSNLLRKLKAVQARWDKRLSPRTDSAVADVVGYVQQQTGKPHDAEVKALLGAILGKTINLKQWRQRHPNSASASSD